MGSGKGGGADSGPMLEYGNKALDLQKQIYDQQRSDAQPWYQTGTSAVNELSKLMGLNNPSASKTGADLRKELLPQYTTSTPAPSTGQYINEKGQMFSLSPQDYGSIKRGQGLPANKQYAGLQPYSSTSATNTVDNDALNTAIQNALSQQSATNAAYSSDPSFGSLAHKFGTEDFQTDPGYEFRLGEGQKALERKLNSSGKTYSPEAAKALMQYNQDFGSNEYNNAYNRFNTDQGNLFNRLATLSGFGQTASGQVANAGSNYANAGTDLYTGMGNAITAANTANAANNSSMFNTLIGAGARVAPFFL